jgi:hypothetical protein
MSRQPDPHTPRSGTDVPARLVPDDPVAFVARAQLATNTCDVEWPMTVYAPTIRLETTGDGIRDVQEGAAAVRPALESLYRWFAATDGTLIAASHDTVVNTWEGRLFGGRQSTYGAEFWRFDQTGHVVHNLLYASLNPKRPTHPVGALRMLLGHPRATWAYLNVRTVRRFAR